MSAPPPTTSADFDRAYARPITFWGDIRIPPEVKSLVEKGPPRKILELGCGIGRFSRYLAKRGATVTAVDFSTTAIEKARNFSTQESLSVDFRVGDVTRLDGVGGPFDAAFDVGCFHCLDVRGQRDYASEVFRLLQPGGTHLIWAMDASPSDLALSPAAVRQAFAPYFELREARASRRRIVRSHWYWLTRTG